MPDVVDPFNRDVDGHGAYRYTDPRRRSCAYANERFTRVILEAAGVEGKRVVDIGCGDGTYTEALLTRGRAASVLGIDPAVAGIERARATYGALEGLSFRQGVAADLATSGERLDLAVVRGVIHHVSRPEKEIAAILAAAEQAFFLEPNGWNPVLKAIERLSPYHRDHGERSYVLERYRRWIAAAGGRVARSFFFGLVPMFAPDWLVSVGSALEPIVERVPLVRRLVCGQVGILASSGPR